MKIEATGNTEEYAEQALAKKRAKISAQIDAHFGEIRKYGNFELGYKLVQDYTQKK